MRLYPKKLNGLKGLQREKQLLRKEREGLTVQHVLSEQVGNIRNAIPGKGVGNILNTILSTVNIEAVTEIAMSFLPLVIRRQLDKKVRRTVLSVAGTVIGGFLKWEAVELGFRGLRLLVRMQKNKKQDKK